MRRRYKVNTFHTDQEISQARISMEVMPHILGSCPLANSCYFAFGKDFDFYHSIPSFQRINVSKLQIFQG